MRSKLVAATVLATMATLAISACGASSGGEQGGRHPNYARALAGSPPPLAALHSQSNQLLHGGTAAYDRRIQGLRGYPIVVNVWASWCGPCRFEFPFFQRVAAEKGKRVAFLGINSQDSDDAAHTFLGEDPVPYPSYTDPDKAIAEGIGATFGLPATAFYDRDGELVHLTPGPYENRAELSADIARYAERGRGSG